MKRASRRKNICSMNDVVQSKSSISPEKLFPECSDSFPSFNFCTGSAKKCLHEIKNIWPLCATPYAGSAEETEWWNSWNIFWRLWMVWKLLFPNCNASYWFAFQVE